METVTIRKINDNEFQITVFKEHEYIEIHKDRYYMEQLAAYIQNTLDDNHIKFDINELDEEKIKKYCEI